jgi:ParB/RepB/Spo0J family partition protein
MKQMVFAPDEIHIANRTRPLNPGRVADLAKSIAEVGLLQPISVRVVPEMEIDGEPWLQVPVLIAGHHRLEALKRLGRKEVSVQVLDVDEIDAERAEIAENLHRAELTALERDVHVARWIKLTEEKQKAEGILGQSDPKITERGRGRPQSGVRAAARDLGIETKDAQRAAKVGNLTDEAKEAARELGLDDHRTALLEAAKKITAEEQVVVLKQIRKEQDERKEARKADPASEAAPAPSLDNDLFMSDLERLKDAFLRLGKNDRNAFLFWALEIYVKDAA